MVGDVHYCVECGCWRTGEVGLCRTGATCAAPQSGGTRLGRWRSSNRTLAQDKAASASRWCAHGLWIGKTTPHCQILHTHAKHSYRQYILPQKPIHLVVMSGDGVCRPPKCRQCPRYGAQSSSENKPAQGTRLVVFVPAGLVAVLSQTVKVQVAPARRLPSAPWLTGMTLAGFT